MKHYKVILTENYPYKHEGFDPDSCSRVLEVVGFKYQIKTYGYIFGKTNEIEIYSLDLRNWLLNNKSQEIHCEKFGPKRFSLLEELVKKEKIARNIIRIEN